MADLRPDEFVDSLELFRRELAESGFGVTLIDRDLVIRTKDELGNLVQATFVAVAIDDGRPQCWGCGERSGLRSCQVSVTVRGLLPNWKRVDLCVDCRCPQ